ACGTYVDFLFFFQAEDGIRDDLVTGVQTCALPISGRRRARRRTARNGGGNGASKCCGGHSSTPAGSALPAASSTWRRAAPSCGRSEERRVGEGGRGRGWAGGGKEKGGGRWGERERR